MLHQIYNHIDKSLDTLLYIHYNHCHNRPNNHLSNLQYKHFHRIHYSLHCNYFDKYQNNVPYIQYKK